MSINLDVLIDTPEHSVDMKTGLETLLGVSDATRSISETVLIGHVPKKQNAKSNVRTNLKQSFKGSYGHEFRSCLENKTARESSTLSMACDLN